jgi:hypothetical protein
LNSASFTKVLLIFKQLVSLPSKQGTCRVFCAINGKT